MTSPQIDPEMYAAREHQAAGRLAEAETIYREVLARDPNRAEALHALGVLAGQTGRAELAANLISRSLVIAPNCAEAHHNLGAIFLSIGRIREAIDELQTAVLLEPGCWSMRKRLGEALQASGQRAEAIAVWCKALELEPGSADLFRKVGARLERSGEFKSAVEIYRRWVESNPSDLQAVDALGSTLLRMGSAAGAVEVFRTASKLDPDNREIFFKFAHALEECRGYEEATQVYEDLIRRNPENVEAYNRLGNARMRQSRFDDAVAAFRAAVEIAPHAAAGHSNLATALGSSGCFEEAVAEHREAIRVDPAWPQSGSELLYALQFHPDYDAPSLFIESRSWAERHASAFSEGVRAHQNEPSPERRLRIGYVSPYFRHHVIAHNLLPLLRRHDHERHEIVCYSNSDRSDAVTEQVRSYADQWRVIAGVDDETAGEMIRNDGIDLLVDLTMHMPDHRLLLFARKPAPVQVCLLSSCSTTGLKEIDYRISDPYIEPDDSESEFYSERVFRLPHSAWCYEPSGPMPEVSSLPAEKNGWVTFGSRNNPAKLSPSALELWAEILLRLPFSRLLLSAPAGSVRKRICETFEQRGVSADRVEFLWQEPWAEFIASYHRIDIALDPWPYNGWITTCDALWMGVPAIAMVGKTPLGRGGFSILANVGLPELVARTRHDYVETAVALASDLPRLATYRSELRGRMAASPLRDEGAYAKEIENAYRKMWRAWCAGGGEQ